VETREEVWEDSWSTSIVLLYKAEFNITQSTAFVLPIFDEKINDHNHITSHRLPGDRDVLCNVQALTGLPGTVLPGPRSRSFS